MPMLLQHIDAIAREKMRDVLFLKFHAARPTNREEQDEANFVNEPTIDWRSLQLRKDIITWLDEQGIDCLPCGSFANTNMMIGYHGQLYIDLPYDKTLPAYQALEAHLELPSGLMRFSEATLYLCTLEMAMKNAEHDEPGFWEKWAENF